MKAVLCEEWGGPEKLVLRDIDPPALGPTQVRIRTAVTALSFVDLLMPRGKYQVKPELPFVPGSHAAGEVIEVGAEVEDISVGERVSVQAQTGGLAEQMIAEAGAAFRLPDGVSAETGAAYGNAYGTSFHALQHRADLQPGETLLVHGAAGGVGLAAVDIGREMGARIIATARGADKAAVLKQYGAEEVIDYTAGPFKERVKDLTDGRGADVIYDPVGGDVFDESLRCVNWGGRILVVGFASGRIPSAPANLALLKGCSVVGVSLGGLRHKEPEVIPAMHATLLDWIAAGRLKPMVSMRFPLEKATQALQAMEARKSIGRVVITMD